MQHSSAQQKINTQHTDKQSTVHWYLTTHIIIDLIVDLVNISSKNKYSINKN